MAFSAAIPLAGFFKAVLVGAAIGAVVGGITAAIKDGDIFKGVLFGAIGGAVTGGIVHGLNSVFTSLSATVTPTGTAGAMGMGADAASLKAAEAGISTAIKPAVTKTVETGFFDGLMTDIGDGFKDIVGDGLGSAMNQGALAAGISGLGQVYNQKKMLEAQEEQAQANREHELAMLDKQVASAEKIASMRGGGGGGGGGRSTADELALIEAQNRGALERVNAEIAGQKSLREQEYAQQEKLRGQASAAASAVAATGREAESRSSESLVDIQERIRNGENQEGEPNVAYQLPIQYVAPTPA